MQANSAKQRHSGFACLGQAYTEMLEWGLLRLSLGILGAAVLTLTVMGPLDTGRSLGPVKRFAFVALCCLCCWPLCHALRAAILYLARHRSPVQILLASFGGALLAAVPCAVIVFTIFGFFHPPEFVPPGLPEIYANVAVLILACSSITHYVACQRVAFNSVVNEDPVAAAGKPAGLDEHAESAVAQDSTERERFLDRLPATLGRDIIYLTVSGHYVNVVTSKGSCLLLMRLSDAIAALGDLGLQVHRSFWVAHEHVSGVLRRDGRMTLRLTGAHDVPVSRTYMAAVRAAVDIA